LVTALRDKLELDAILDQLADYPILKNVLTRFATSNSGPKQTGDYLKLHELHLQWHIHRLYRIRCDIVHSASSVRGLGLYSANLEFYLKVMLRSVISSLGAGGAKSLNEHYHRVEYAYDTLMSGLAKGDESALASLLTGRADY
jgi:hypothetical protein